MKRHMVLALLLGTALPASAHEFWLDPDPLSSGAYSVDIRVGEQGRGSAYPYLPDRIAQAWIADAQGHRPLTSRLGNKPAFRITPREGYLSVLGYQSTPSRVTYANFEKFAQFVRSEGLPHLAQRHKERQLPERGFSELFTRYAKTAITGPGAGEALPETPVFWFDLSLQSGPDPESRTLILSRAVQPVSNHPVFAITAGQRRPLITDAQGRVVIEWPLKEPTLFNAVWMEEVPRGAAVWHSHWASFYLDPSII